jgi:hypothetical protein
MMVLEQEIIEKFRQLAPESRMRVLVSLQEEIISNHLSLAEWLTQVDAVRFTLERAVSASDLVNEVREERDADILRSLGFRDSTSDSSD